MPRKHLITAATILALGAGSALAKTYTVLGAGINSCGAWASHHQPEAYPTVANVGAAYAEEQWVLGFLSGLNTNWPDTSLSDGTDAAGMFAWISKYCAAHPLDHLDEASSALANELGYRQIKKALRETEESLGQSK